MPRPGEGVPRWHGAAAALPARLVTHARIEDFRLASARAWCDLGQEQRSRSAISGRGVLRPLPWLVGLPLSGGRLIRGASPTLRPQYETSNFFLEIVLVSRAWAAGVS